MPLFGVQFGPNQAASFQQGIAQGAQMSQFGQGMQEKRRQFDAMAPMREAQVRVQEALASKMEGLLQGEIEAGNARNAAVPVQVELATQALTQEVAGQSLANEVAYYDFEEQRALQPQRLQAARAAAVEAEVRARTAMQVFEEFNAPQARKIRNYTQEAQARMLGKGLEQADTELRAANLKVEAEQFALDRLQATTAVQDLSDEAYAAGFGAIRDTLPDDLANAVQGILDSDDPDMTKAMKGAAAKQVVTNYYEQKSFQYARNATTNMTTLRRKLAEMPELMQDDDFTRGLQSLASAQRQGQYGLAAALTQGLIESAGRIQFSAEHNEKGLALLTQLQSTYGSLGGSALDKSQLPETIDKRATMTPSSWLDHQQSRLEELMDERLTEGEWYRWLHQTLGPLDTSQDLDLLNMRVEALNWIMAEDRSREALGGLPLGGGQSGTNDSSSKPLDLDSVFGDVKIRN